MPLLAMMVSAGAFARLATHGTDESNFVHTSGNGPFHCRQNGNGLYGTVWFVESS